MTVILLALAAGLDYSVNAGAVAAYEDNIFEYSRMHLENFLSGDAPERYPFETYDDLRTTVDFGLLVRSKLAAGATTSLNLGAAVTSFAVNNSKDYQVYRCGLRQSFDEFSVKLEYLLMPDYLIRYYRDPAAGGYSGCAFTEHLVTLKGTYRFGRTAVLAGAVKREFDDYTAHFDAYDSESYRFGARAELVRWDVAKPAVAYEFKDLRGRGPLPDISYDQHELSAGLRLLAPRPKFSRWDVACTLAWRAFTTELSPLVDAPHSGRSDLKGTLAAGLQFPILPGLYLSCGYAYEYRNSYSAVYPEIGELNNYRKWTGSGGVEFEF